MKTHTQNSPETIRGLRDRRSLRALLDTRRKSEADLRNGEYVGPFGKGFHTVKNPGGGITYVVADQTGGRTFAAGTSILLASTTGAVGEAVIGGAPAGKKGGISRTRNRRITGSLAAYPNQYAFGIDGLGNMVALLYEDGVYSSLRATEVEVSGVYTGCILTDSSLVVGVGSLLMHDGSTLRVWDVEGAVFYSYTAPSGWTNPTAPYYQNGALYWVEFEDITPAAIGSGEATFDYRLRTAATDLSGVSTIATVTSAAASSYGAPFTAYDVPPLPFAFAVDEDGAILYFGFYVTETTNHEIIEWHGLRARFAVAGGAPATQAWVITEFRTGASTGEPLAGGFPCATIGTTSFAICTDSGSGYSVLAKADNESADSTNLWPADNFDGGIYPLSLNVGTGGSVLQVCYGADLFAATGLMRGVASGTVIVSAIDAFDGGTSYPTAMFYFGT